MGVKSLLESSKDLTPFLFLPSLFIILLTLPFTVFLYWFAIPIKWRDHFILICSLLLVICISFKYAIYLIFITCLSFYAGIFCHPQYIKKGLVLKSTLVFLVGSLCFFKYSNSIFNTIKDLGILSQTEFPQILFPLGISYISFRLIHYVVDSYRDKIPKSSFIDFALYILFFPTFFAGPIERFQKFYSQTSDKNNFNISYLHDGVYRITCGVIKKGFIVYYLTKFVLPILNAPEKFSRPIIIISIYGLAMMIYVDFSAYSDIAIGSAKLFGYTIIENFNYPFLKENIALFWRNWHISLYIWMRDYFFFPFFGTHASSLKLYMGIFITLMVFHLWHEASINLFILGLYHVFGLTGWLLFQEIQHKNLLLKKWVTKKWMKPVWIFFTYSFVSFGMVLFYFDIEHYIKILKIIFST